MAMKRGMAVALGAVSLLLLAALFLGGGPDDGQARSWKALWNLGHVATFVVWTLAALSFLPRLAAMPWSRQARWVLGAGAALALLIEGLQSFTAREASLVDVATSLVGALLALAFASPAITRLAPRRRRAVRLAAVTLLVASLAPLALALLDEALARRQFPVLSDFESPLERARWDSRADFAISDRRARHGHHALRVRFTTERYSTIGMRYFPRDWRGHAWLRFSIYNPQPRALALTLRIHDRRHVRHGMPHGDRFTRRLLLRPGWNDYRVSLAEVRRAPLGREMDLAQMAELAFYVSRQPRRVTLYFDHLRLE